LRYTQKHRDIVNYIEIKLILDDLGIPYKTATHTGELMLIEHKSCKINNNKWYRFSKRTGGYPVQFLTYFYNQTEEEAISYLLKLIGKENIEVDEDDRSYTLHEPKHTNNNSKIVKYLLFERCIDEEVLRYFIESRLIYEDDKYHNVVFIGKDNEGEVKHIAKRSTNITGEQIKLNAYGSDARYSFHYNGFDNKLYIFESPIDMLSYITLNKDNWKNHSYLSMCGLNEEPIREMLLNNAIDTLCIGLDNDDAGENYSYYINNCKEFRKYKKVIINPRRKDFNEDLKEINDRPFIILGNINNNSMKIVINELVNLLKDSKCKDYNDLMSDYTFMYSKRNKIIDNKELILEYCNKVIIDIIKLSEQQYNHMEEKNTKDEILKRLVSIPLELDPKKCNEWFDYCNKSFKKVTNCIINRNQFQNTNEKKDFINVLLYLGKVSLKMELFILDEDCYE
jgi:hypothetical protein